MQLDRKAGERKVIAFLDAFYRKQYGFTPSGTFSIEMDPQGERLFICWNGGFYDDALVESEERGSLFLHNAIMLVHIPERERQES